MTDLSELEGKTAHDANSNASYLESGMNGKEVKSPMFVYPDPVTGPEMLSGASFLYFQTPLLFTIPPQVMSEGSYALLPFIDERQPYWSSAFYQLFGAWRYQQDNCRATLETLEPLKDKAFKVVWFVYPATSEALELSATLAASSGLSLDSIAELINPLNASGEIIRHIMLEAYFELGEDIQAHFNHCEDILTREPLSHLLAKGYLLRLPMLSAMAEKNLPILLTNEALTKFLFGLPVETTVEAPETFDIDVIAWELFRQILSPRLDPLSEERVMFIAELLRSRSEQIDRLRQKCLALAQQLKQPESLRELTGQVERFIKAQVEKEIADLLELDRQSLHKFFVSLFADEKTWLALSTFIAGIVKGHAHLTIGAAIAALSTVGAKSFKVAADRREKLRKDDYALVYTISREG